MTLGPDVIAQIEALAAQLMQQANHYRALLGFAERQHAALAAHDMAEFNALLAEKAAVMGQLAQVEAAMAPNRAVWDSHRDTVSAELREQLRATVDDIRGLLERVLETERACETQLQATKAEVTEELRQLGQGKRALQTYGSATPPPTPPRLDLGG